MSIVDLEAAGVDLHKNRFELDDISFEPSEEMQRLLHEVSGAFETADLNDLDSMFNVEGGASDPMPTVDNVAVEPAAQESIAIVEEATKDSTTDLVDINALIEEETFEDFIEGGVFEPSRYLGESAN